MLAAHSVGVVGHDLPWAQWVLDNQVELVRQVPTSLVNSVGGNVGRGRISVSESPETTGYRARGKAIGSGAEHGVQSLSAGLHRQGYWGEVLSLCPQEVIWRRGRRGTNLAHRCRGLGKAYTIRDDQVELGQQY